MKAFVNKYKIHIIFSIFGGVGGYLYWSYVGCSSGTCMITSVWYHSTAYGMLMGYLVGGMVQDNRKKKPGAEELNS